MLDAVEWRAYWEMKCKGRVKWGREGWDVCQRSQQRPKYFFLTSDVFPATFGIQPKRNAALGVEKNTKNGDGAMEQEAKDGG